MNKSKTIILMTLLLNVCSCNQNNESTITMIIPDGTPLLGMSLYLKENNNVNYEITSGSESLSASFINESKDIIIAPVNLGANMYSKTGKYVLFETFVWGNLFLVSRNQITSFEDINNKQIAIFGTNQTPDIIMKTLAIEHEINYEKYYTDSVANSTALFMQGNVDYFVGAEPSLSSLKSKNPNLYVLDLQEEWKKITGSSSYPQAGIFVKLSEVNRLKSHLKKMRDSVKDLFNDVNYTSECALELPSLNKLGKDVIISALPNCHFGIDINQKEAIEFYYNKLESLNLSQTMGGVIPNEEFYLSI